MKVLTVTPYWPPEGGGLERYAKSIADGLVARGHEVVVCAATRAAAAPRAESLAAAGSRTAAAPGHPPDPPDHPPDHPSASAPPSARAHAADVRLHGPLLRIGNAPVAPGFTSRLRRIIRREGIDVVVGHSPVPLPAEAAARAAARENVPFVLTYHAGQLRGSSRALDALAAVARVTTQRRLYHRSDAIIAVSDFVRDHALAGHARKAHVVPPGVDTARFRPGPASRVDRRQVLFVGPLDTGYRWKGVDVLWEALCRLRQQGIEARLRLVGSGDRAAHFRGLAATRHDVQVDDRLPEPELVRAYQQAGVVVLPSLTDAEAFGMVLAEANACGRPVVASRVGGIPDFVRPGVNGLLVPPGDAAALAAALAPLLDAPRRQDSLGRAGRRIVSQEHRWPVLVKRTEHLLDQVSSGGGAPWTQRSIP